MLNFQHCQEFETVGGKEQEKYRIETIPIIRTDDIGDMSVGGNGSGSGEEAEKRLRQDGHNNTGCFNTEAQLFL